MKTILYIILVAFSVNAQVDKLLVGNKSASTPAAATYEYFITADGDTFYVSGGDALKVRISYLEFKKEGKDNEKDFISDKSLFAVLPERKRTA